MIEWIEKIIYLIPSDITINFSVRKKGKESLVTKKYSNKYGLYDLTKKLCPKSILDPIHFIDSVSMKEIVHDKSIDRYIGLEVAFTYSSTSIEFVSESFCNFVSTIDDGVHVDAVKTAILQYLTKQTKESLSERESNKIDITFSDASQGLFLATFLSTDFQTHFTGQTKEKLGNSELFKPIRELAYKNITNYFNKNPKELKKIIDRIKTNAKARLESIKIRNSVIRGETNNFDEFLMENFKPANNNKGGYKELYIIEGKSARGSADNGRFDRDTQAIFSIRGVPLNSLKLNLDRVLLNAEFNTLVKILGTNIGTRFDITKLKYDKIILMADADSDGYCITSMLCAFFITHMPELIKNGHVYKAVTPLYRIKSKYKKFILNKREYVKIFEKQIRDSLCIEDINTNKKYTDKDMEELLLNNRTYLDELMRLSNQLVIHPLVLEYILIHRNDKDFLKKFKKKFPELNIDEDNVMTGIYEGKYQILIMDRLFYRRLGIMDNYINNVNNNVMYFKVYEKYNNDTIDKGVLSLGEFLMLAQKFQPVIETRYKGVGELNASDLRDNALDPSNRILIRLTTEDIERDFDIFDTLHGNDSDERKLLMKHFKINRDDLDN